MRYRLFFFFALFGAAYYAQPPGTWQDHVSLNSCNSVTRLGNTIYASYYNGLMYFDYEEIAPRQLNKINGLNDVGIRLVRANHFNNRMVVVYENSNIDVIDASGQVFNFPALRLKTMSAKKTVNEVTFDKQFAYLACGFGIVVFDTEKLEIKETYYIGADASNVDVFQVALSPTQIFAATMNGLYQAQRNTSLVNFNNWQLNVGLPAGVYNGVVVADGEVITNKSLFAEKGENFHDTLYHLTSGGWQVFPHASGQGKTILKFGHTDGVHFSILQSISVQVINVHTGAPHMLIQGFNGEIEYGTLRDCYFYSKGGWYTYWVADRKFGLFKATTLWDPYEKVLSNGMNNRNISNIDIRHGMVAVSPSHVFKEGQGTFTSEGINLYENGEWTYVPVTIPGESGQLQDINSVLIDRIDKTIMWATAWRYGILEFKNNQLVRTYTPDNAEVDDDGSGTSLPGALTQDEQGNVYFSNYLSSSPIGMIRRSDRKYVSYAPPGGGPPAKFTRRMLFDRNGNLWAAHERESGITVFEMNAAKSVTRVRSLSQMVGEGNLGSNSVYCITEDHDGRLWIGTGAGIRVIYNGGDVFKEGADIDAQPIKIEQDGNVELLLGGETVTDIHVDGANNKWVGTSTGGIYCFSPDGMRQLSHFTAENSPLYSNSVLDLDYDAATGDLFIATEQGLQTYRGVVIAGFEDYSTLHAYPNPVRPGYTGSVLLRGLMDDSLVKITDVAGNLVWETRAAGGQVAWPLTTLTGSRVTAGVYIVYASTAAAEHKAVTKVLVMN